MDMLGGTVSVRVITISADASFPAPSQAVTVTVVTPMLMARLLILQLSVPVAEPDPVVAPVMDQSTEVTPMLLLVEPARSTVSEAVA